MWLRERPGPEECAGHKQHYGSTCQAGRGIQDFGPLWTYRGAGMYRREAREIIAAQGSRAHQHALDLMVGAVRDGEDLKAKYYEKVLREVERRRYATVLRGEADQA